jgi:hypothetical protein
MRRRINIPPDGTLEDITGWPYLYSNHGDDGALYNEPLWEAFCAARDAFGKIEHAVIAALRSEPFDDVERKAAADADALMVEDVRDLDAMDAIAARCVEHAKTLDGNIIAPKQPQPVRRTIGVIIPNDDDDAAELVMSGGGSRMTTRTVNALVYGHFAAHPQAERSGWSKSVWSVTHVPSGIAVPVGQILGVLSCERATAIAAVLGREIDAPDLLAIQQRKAQIIKLIKEHAGA